MLDVKVSNDVLERWSGEALLTVSVLGRCKNRFVNRETFISDWHKELMRIEVLGVSVLAEEMVLKMRSTFKAMPDMDPSRYRPASESLLRRLIDGKSMSISPLVDVNNLVSVKYRIPIGIYDTERIRSLVWIYRLGVLGEEYLTFSGSAKNASGKLVLTDVDGIFGSPVADSGRASVGDTTESVAIVSYLPFEVSIVQAGLLEKMILGDFASFIDCDIISSQVVKFQTPK